MALTPGGPRQLLPTSSASLLASSLAWHHSCPQNEQRNKLFTRGQPSTGRIHAKFAKLGHLVKVWPPESRWAWGGRGLKAPLQDGRAGEVQRLEKKQAIWTRPQRKKPCKTASDTSSLKSRGAVFESASHNTRYPRLCISASRLRPKLTKISDVSSCGRFFPHNLNFFPQAPPPLSSEPSPVSFSC